MSRSWTGPLITGLVVVGVGAVLLSNLQRPAGPGSPPAAVESTGKSAPASARPAAGGAREQPIGEPSTQNHIQVAAVYLPAVAMDGSDPVSPGGPELIHLEADIKATQDNPNGFAKDEFVPYLKVAYEIAPARGGPPVAKGELFPMVAWDGLHYGANVAMPPTGEYRLSYDIQPPSVGGLGRHSDRATGVAPWWKPFRATFEWTVEPRAATPELAGSR